MNDRFVKQIAALIRERHRSGLATQMNTTVGTPINRTQYKRSLAYFASARSEGREKPKQ